MTSRSSFISAPPVNSTQYRQEVRAYFEYLVDQFMDDEIIYDMSNEDACCPEGCIGCMGDLPF